MPPTSIRSAADPTTRILDAAREVFAVEGLDAGLETIAQKAGVGVASIYRRYANKNDLIQEIAEARFAELVERMSRALDAPDAWDAFSVEFRRSVGEYAADRGFRELVLASVTGSLGWARGSEPTELRAAMRRWSAEIESVIGRLLGRARDVGALRADANGAVVRLLSMALQSAAGLGTPAEHDLAIEIVLDGLRARTS